MNTEFIRPIQRPGFPYWKMPGAFLGLIALGTVLLKLPIAHQPGRALTWLDAAFTAVSAVCVTGLTTVNTGETLSRFGEVVLLGLIQMGGIGIVTAGTLFMLLRGQRLTFADEKFLSAAIGRLQHTRPRDVFVFTCVFVAVCELAGAAALFPMMSRAAPGETILATAWEALFQCRVLDRGQRSGSMAG
jgi:trk system potassium uptake protein TrkH